MERFPAPDDALDNSLTIEEVAEHFKISIRTLGRWRDAGEFVDEYRMPGGGVRFLRQDVLAWFEARRVKRKPRQREAAPTEARHLAFSELDVGAVLAHPLPTPLRASSK